MQLIAELRELPFDQAQGFYVQVESPPAPGYAMAKLCFLPADRCINGGNEEGEEHGLLLPGRLREHCEKVVHVEPGFVAALVQKRMCDSE